MSKRTKKAPPSFDVARADLGTQGARWVYRSDVPAPVTEPRAPMPIPVIPNPSPEPARRVLLTRPVPERTATGWLMFGVGIIGLPLAIPVVATLLPVSWMTGSRSRR